MAKRQGIQKNAAGSRTACAGGAVGGKMICIPADIKVDDKSIIAQMERVTEAQRVLENEMSKLRGLLMNTQVKEKGDS